MFQPFFCLYRRGAVLFAGEPEFGVLLFFDA
jgi:hypothetical protein